MSSHQEQQSLQLEYNDYLELKKNMIQRLEETKIERL